MGVGGREGLTTVTPPPPSPGLCLVNVEAGLGRPWALDVCSTCFQGMAGMLPPLTEPEFTMVCALQP